MTKHSAVKATLTALTLGVTLGLAGCGSNDAGGTSGMDHGSASPSMSQMPSSSAPASETAAAQFNDADVMFVQGMLPHHSQAVEMSDGLLKKPGISAETTALAKQVKAAQQPEITTMEGWLKAWGESADGGTGHGGMGDDGMATDADMKKFDQTSGASAEKVYLEMMTAHHEGAITMANAQIQGGENPDAVQMAKDIVSTQQAEVDTMKKMLARL
ncbi:MAG TPA: DUF305 domain-containing protein [Propionibacteriaceae bacterium]|nr:DUF305 domain-containing protein [Propionibacteriaceae bacterium]